MTLFFELKKLKELKKLRTIAFELEVKINGKAYVFNSFNYINSFNSNIKISNKTQ